MTEPEKQKLSDFLNQHLESLKKDTLLLIEERLKSISDLNKQEKHDDKHTHTSKDVFDCPECGNVYLEEAKKRVSPKIMKEFKEKLKNKEFIKCDGCGEIVERTEEQCPDCGSTDGKEF